MFYWLGQTGSMAICSNRKKNILSPGLESKRNEVTPLPLLSLEEISVLTSRSNQHVQQLDGLLRRKKEREASGRFVLEGRRLCLDAAEKGLTPEYLFLTKEAFQKAPEKLTNLVLAAGETVWLSEELSVRIGDTQTPQGVFAIFRTPSFAPEAVPHIPQGRYLLLHQIRDPGNLGSILRTAAALGATGVFLCQCAELCSPKTLRASMGGIWRLPIGVCEEMPLQIQKLQEIGIYTIAAALKEDAVGPEALQRPGGKAVLIGNEGDGLPDELIRACDQGVMLPMQGGAESLGAAMAAGILLWELTRSV